MKQTSFKQSDVYGASKSEDHIIQMEQPMVIEKTAKKYKLGMLVGVLMTIAGLALFFLTKDTEYIAFLGIIADILFVGGIITVVVSRFRAWWNHG